MIYLVHVTTQFTEYRQTSLVTGETNLQKRDHTTEQNRREPFGTIEPRPSNLA